MEQIPAVVFMAYLDRGIGEAYVSPQIEAALGFSQEEWLEDPVRWYSHIHPDDKQRWSTEAAEMFLTGNPLRSAYRVVARDGRVIWFHCEAKMIRKEDGNPGSFTALDSISRTSSGPKKRCRKSVMWFRPSSTRSERWWWCSIPRAGLSVSTGLANRPAAIPSPRLQVRKSGMLFMVPEEVDRFKADFRQLCADQLPSDYEGYLVKRDGVAV